MESYSLKKFIIIITIFFLHQRTHVFFIAFGERGREREREREKHRLVAPRMCPGHSCGLWIEPASALGMFPDRKPNRQLFSYGTTLQPTEPHWPGLLQFLLYSMWPLYLTVCL